MTVPRSYAEYGYWSPDQKVTESRRPEHPIVVSWITHGSRVVDLGCGDGTLAARLRDERACTVVGLDASPNAIAQAKVKGVTATVADLDEPLPFPADAFDVSVLNVVLPYTHYPDRLLTEATRVARRAIVSFPNFGFVLARAEALLGRYPRCPLHGYEWYNTRLLHPCSLSDFRRLAALSGLAITREAHLRWDARRQDPLSTWWPSLFARVCIVEVVAGTGGRVRKLHDA